MLNERDRRWRLILGQTEEDQDDAGQDGEQGQPGQTGDGGPPPEGGLPSLSDEDGRMDRALEQLYGDGNDEGDLSDADPDIARWLGDIRKWFSEPVAQLLQRDMLDKSNLRKLLNDPDLMDKIEPDIHLVSNILALRRMLPSKTKETAKQVVRKIVDQLREQLSRPLEQAVRGAIHRPTVNRRPRHKEINWGRTVYKNLKHYQPSHNTVVPEQLIGYGRQDKGLRDIIVCVDTSGSMASSMVYAGIYASVMASLPAISTKLVMFSTSVVDLTDELDDPVDMLFGIQLRGGTNIEKAVAYCEQIVERPTDTTLILITDLFEGGDKELLVDRLNALTQRGVQTVTLLALNDEGAPRFSRELAQQLVMLGIPSFACTPQHFPGLMGAILDGRDVDQWAAGQGIVTAPDN
ncbi:MAG: VWA domain-containing protein [Chloroflexota bacterium]